MALRDFRRLPVPIFLERWAWRHAAEACGFTDREAARLAFIRWLAQQWQQTAIRRGGAPPAGGHVTDLWAPVTGVISRQGIDRSALFNAAAQAAALPPRLLVALGIAESNLDEVSRRPPTDAEIAAYWPDVSAGCFHEAAAWSVVGDRTPSLANWGAFYAYFADIHRAAPIAARKLGAYWRQYGDPLEAMGRYNWPAQGYQGNPNAANIRRAWDASAHYVQGESMDWAPVDVRERYPFEGCELDTRPLSQIAEVIYHHGASRHPAPTRDDELALLDAYHRLHVGKGWCVVAYHLAVGPSGTAYYANNLNLVTYHATTANPTAVGIVFLGDYSQEAPSPEMCAAAVQARQWVARQLGQSDLPYRGHKDVSGGTACPGAWWPEPGRALLAPWGNDDEPAPEIDRVAELESQLGYLTGDLAKALQAALDGARDHDPWHERARRTDWEQRQDAYRALQAAINTLKRGGADAPL